MSTENRPTPDTPDVAGMLAAHPRMLNGTCRCDPLLPWSPGHVAAALAPLLAARDAGVLDAAADAVEDECMHSTERCFCGSADWLRDRARTYREGS